MCFRLINIADSMVMAGEGEVQEDVVENMETGDSTEERSKVSEREKELAADASTAYNTGDYSQCLLLLEKLEVG